MELRDDHSVCLSRLRDISEDIASLRAENSRLRSANFKLLKLLAICPRAIEANTGSSLPFNYSPPNTIGYNRRRHCEVERGQSPNSVPVRSRMANGHSVSEQNRIVGHKVTSRVQEQHGQLELQDQGALKTELCNKWEATGACPYGLRCGFAHGIGELRPIPQDHRYKTDVCRVVRDGQTCPYGHRCHFRHSLTRQEMIALKFIPAS